MSGDERILAESMRGALRRLAKAVVIITCKHDGRRYAMTATAVSELSMDPPSLLICVNRGASSAGALAAGADYGVNILPASQESIARRCAGGVFGEDRFLEGAWREAPGGTPYLEDSQAFFICSQDGRMSYGTHEIIIGRVKSVGLTGSVDPLVYVDGRYTNIPDKS
jgi:flavin reductase (DIM6/NTAB) family NADH-FMN oxidoreductase RutF